MNEFELIRTYFASQGLARDDVIVPIGDDAAVVKPPADMEQVLTTDLLVAGQHFLVDASPCAIGHKALAVNLSDLAAMGASPAWFTLNLSIPDADRTWLEGFADGLFELAQ
ncbi:MAG: thiamine-monophosphate kinase [Acidiferrobacterales bacterium]